MTLNVPELDGENNSLKLINKQLAKICFKWSVLKRAQNQTDVFRKDSDGFYSNEIEKGILMRIVSYLMRMISTFEAFYEKDDKEG